MPDRENVIRGWETVLSRDPLDAPWDLIDDTLALLKEQEAVEPNSEHHMFVCPVCRSGLSRYQKFCHECGKRIEWKGR